MHINASTASIYSGFSISPALDSRGLVDFESDQPIEHGFQVFGWLALGEPGSVSL